MTCSTAVDRYDPATNAWTPRAPLPSPRGYETATVLGDGRVLLVGGCAVPACATVLGDAVLYDPAANAWTNAGTLTDVRAGHSATLLANGSVLVAGGCADAHCMRTLPTAELWSPLVPTGGAFRAAATMPGARHNHSATTLATGEILFAGGANGASTSLPNAQVYVPTDNRWANVESMHLDRAYHVAMRLNSNNVLLAGGCNPRRACRGRRSSRPPTSPRRIAPWTVAAQTQAAMRRWTLRRGPTWWSRPSTRTPRSTVRARTNARPTPSELACPLRAYPLQDGDFPTNDMSFRVSGNEITDTVSGLTWQVAVDATERNQAAAVAYCASYATAATPAGQWRLPSVVELATLVNYGVNVPSIDPRFTNTLPVNYWTTTPVASGNTQTWTVKFDFGELIPFGNARGAMVRCVHEHMPNTDAGVPGRLRQAGPLVADGLTVRDESTGLEWQREDDGVRRTWQDSLVYCATLNLAGKTGWHLSNTGELRSLVEYGGTAGGAVIDPAFPNARPEHLLDGDTQRRRADAGVEHQLQSRRDRRRDRDGVDLRSLRPSPRHAPDAAAPPPRWPAAAATVTSPRRPSTTLETPGTACGRSGSSPRSPPRAADVGAPVGALCDRRRGGDRGAGRLKNIRHHARPRGREPSGRAGRVRRPPRPQRRRKIHPARHRRGPRSRRSRERVGAGARCGGGLPRRPSRARVCPAGARLRSLLDRARVARPPGRVLRPRPRAGPVDRPPPRRPRAPQQGRERDARALRGDEASGAGRTGPGAQAARGDPG